MFLEISQDSQENTCASFFCNKVAGLRPAISVKNETLAQVFSCEFCAFLGTPFLQNTSGRLLLKSNVVNQISCSLKKAKFDFLINDPNQSCSLLTDKFRSIVNKHAPLKKKFVRGKNAPFINRECQKEIFVRRLRNKIRRKSIKERYG